jgi:glycosyltransferase involved in cell wall biosynthesis
MKPFHNMKPSITAVIPTFQRPAQLRCALQSVLNQTFPDFRVCVYGDASGDETAAVVKEFQARDPRVEYIRRPQNIGWFANFMDGANRVTTPYFSFLSDDDVMLPRFFEVAIDGFRRHPEAGLSILTAIRMSLRGFVFGAPILDWPEGLLPAPAGMLAILRYGNPDLAGLLIRRDVWEPACGFDENIGIPSDLDFELRVSGRFPVVVSKEPGGILLVHGGSVTSEACLDWVWPALPRMASKLASDERIPESARREATEIITKRIKKNLLSRGLLGSISRERWDDAERAATLFIQQCKWAHGFKIIAPATKFLKRLPGARWSGRALLAAEDALRVLRHLNLQWRYRHYSKMLCVSSRNPVSKQSSDGLRQGVEICDRAENKLNSEERSDSVSQKRTTNRGYVIGESN